MAETGVGKPITQHLKKISKEGVPVNLYDTKGLELSESVQAEIKINSYGLDKLVDVTLLKLN